MVLGVDDFPILTRCTAASEHEVQIYAFDILAVDGDHLRACPCTCEKTDLERLWRGVRSASPLRLSSLVRSGRTYSERPAAWVSKD